MRAGAGEPGATLPLHAELHPPMRGAPSPPLQFMNILYTNFHTGPGIGGHTVYVQRLAQALAGRHRIAIATPEGSSLQRLGQDIAGVRVHAQDYPNRLPRIPAARARLRAVLRQGDFDVIHVNGSSDHRLVLLASLGMRRPRIVFTKHNDLPVGPIGAWLRSRLGTDHVIAVCDYVARMLADTPYRRCGVTAIRNGIDTDFFAPLPDVAARRERERWLGADGQHKLLLGSNAGTDDYKGWIDLVRAVALLPPSGRQRVHIVIAGDAPAADALREVAALGLESQFSYAGRLDDVRPLVAAFDVGFVLSHRVETISFACREMMAMGKPVIVTDHAGLPENVTAGEDGWVVPVRDPAALAELLQRMLRGEFRLDEMGARARARSEREFGLQPFVAATEQVYERVVRQAR